MRRSTTLIALCSTLAATLAAVWLPGALAARRAVAATALESSVLNRNIEFLERRVAADTDNWLLAGHLADLLARRFQQSADLGDIGRAETLARAALRLRAASPAAHARLASLLLTQHRFREAYASARTAVSFPDAGDVALAAFVDAARGVGDYAGADSALARITPGTFTSAVRTATAAPAPRRAAQRINRACERLEELGAARDLRAWCFTRLAAAEHTRKGARAAEHWLRQALEVQPQHRGAIEMLADMAYARADWKKARQLYGRILSDAHPDLHLRLAEVERALGFHDSAVRHEQRFLALASAPDAAALNGLMLAAFHARNGRCYDAARLAGTELATRRSAEALEAVAWIRFDCGDAASAAALLAEARSTVGLSPSGDYLDALLMQHGGDHESAAGRLRAATADPTRLDHSALYHLHNYAPGTLPS